METLTSTLTAKQAELTVRDGYLWLLEVNQGGPTGGVWRLAFWTDDVSYDKNDGFGAQTYFAIAGEVGELSQEEGTLNELTVTVSNVTGLALGKAEAGLLVDQRVRLLILDAGDQTAGQHQELIYKLMSTDSDATKTTFQLGRRQLLHRDFPRERVLPDRCNHRYKDKRCAAVSVETTCDKSYANATGCAGRNNQSRYGGFPHLLRRSSILLG